MKWRLSNVCPLDLRRGGAACALVAAVLLAGCRPSSPGMAPGIETGSGQWREELFTFAIDNLNRLEDYAPGEMLEQIVERLNQWSTHQLPPADWRLDPLALRLPESLAKMAEMKDPGRMDFSEDDGDYLRESVWMRDVAAWARGDEIDDVARARRLFDWVVRNIQLEPAVSPDGKARQRVPVLPWQTLLSGRGTAIERAWVFLLLARQQGIEAALIGLPVGGASQSLRPWALGVLVEGEVSLFDPALGLPIPAPGPLRRGEGGALDVVPARLAQLAADPALLARLDDGPEHPYSVKPEQLKGAVALVEASPEALSRRMKLIESRLSGKQKVALTAEPTAASERWRKARGLADAGMWLYPFETRARMHEFPAEVANYRQWLMEPFLAAPAAGLWKGRLLHLRGVFGGDNGATACYQLARPSNTDLEEAGSALAQHYFKKGMEANPDRSADEARQDAENRAGTHAMLIFRAKYDASYWLGLIAYERGNWASATDYLSQRTLKAVPDGLWSAGARYNLARTEEASGRAQEAVKRYRANAKQDADVGQAVRAAWLTTAR